MKPYPVTVIDFQDAFPTEEACYEYLRLLRWPEGFICPHCSHTDALKVKRGIYRCKGCKGDVSLTMGTIFQGTRKPLRLWFQAMWYAVNQKHGVSALGLIPIVRSRIMTVSIPVIRIVIMIMMEHLMERTRIARLF